MAFDFKSVIKNTLGDTVTADQIESLNTALVEVGVPRGRLNEVLEEKNGLQDQLTTLDNTLKELKKKAGDSDDLQNQLKTLTDARKADQEKYESTIAQIKQDSQMESALLAAGAKKASIAKVALLEQLGEVKTDKDGNIIGLAEAVEATVKSDGFLFNVAAQQETPKVNLKGATPMSGVEDAGVVDASDFATRLKVARDAKDNLSAIQIKQEAALEGVYLN